MIILVLIGYLLGSLCAGIIYAHLKGESDPRTVGSGNAGATNVLRIQGLSAAIIVLCGDLLKGTIAVLLASYFGIQPLGLATVALSVVLGHCYPIFFDFTGGKGVITAFGSLLPLFAGWSLIPLLIWIGVAIHTRYSSFAALSATASIVLLAPWLLGWVASLPILLMCAILAYRHRANIVRLLSGVESKISI